MLNTSTKRFVNGKSCGFDLDDMRCWEYVEKDDYTDVTFKSGSQVRFREDLREQIRLAQSVSAASFTPNAVWSNIPLKETISSAEVK